MKDFKGLQDIVDNPEKYREIIMKNEPQWLSAAIEFEKKPKLYKWWVRNWYKPWDWLKRKFL